MKKSNGPKGLIQGIDGVRRRILTALLAGGSVAALGGTRGAVANTDEGDDDDLRFPGDEPEHKVVYQFNKGEESYHNSVLFSVGAVLRKYGDNVKIVVVCFGPGIHVLAKKPQRPVSDMTRQRVSSLHQYGIEFHACGNTLKSLNWSEDDLVPFAKHVEVGAADLMELQEQGFAYLSW